MSALAKPMVHSSRATRFQPINAEEIITFEEQTITNPVGSASAKYSIAFSVGQEGVPRIITWEYANQADMNSDYAGLLSAISTVVL